MFFYSIPNFLVLLFLVIPGFNFCGKISYDLEINCKFEDSVGLRFKKVFFTLPMGFDLKSLFFLFSFFGYLSGNKLGFVI